MLHKLAKGKSFWFRANKGQMIDWLLESEPIRKKSLSTVKDRKGERRNFQKNTQVPSKKVHPDQCAALIERRESFRQHFLIWIQQKICDLKNCSNDHKVKKYGNIKVWQKSESRIAIKEQNGLVQQVKEGRGAFSYCFKVWYCNENYKILTLSFIKREKALRSNWHFGIENEKVYFVTDFNLAFRLSRLSFSSF